MREILRILDEANARGLDARGYWESDNLFTLGDILPRHAPDILEGIRRRHAAGLDEVLLAPANNGLFAAMTDEEMRASLRWAISNPWGSGAMDLFGPFTPIVRPQEYMFTTGSIPILESEGVRGVILGYSNYPFTAFSNFVPPLPPEQRYNPLWLRTEEGGPRTIVLPAVSVGDVVNFVSFEKWLIELRKLQTSGQVKRDLLLHINFDADAETWLPMTPWWLRWLPNSGGLEEYIAAVNEYDWAEFTTPGEYLKTHEPPGEVVVRQDMADGGWDGHYSWAEKAASHDLWTGIERARLALRQRDALCAGSAERECRRDPSDPAADGFADRIRALSTTHFGMSTPVVNEERQAVAEQIVGRSLAAAQAALERVAGPLPPRDEAAPADLYRLRIEDLDDAAGSFALPSVRVPLVLPADTPDLLAVDGAGKRLPALVRDRQPLPDGREGAMLEIFPPARSGARKLEVRVATAPETHETRVERRIANGKVELAVSENGQIGLRGTETAGGGSAVVVPFLTYARDGVSRTYQGPGFTGVAVLRHGGDVQELRARTSLLMGDGGDAPRAHIGVRFTLVGERPWVLADADVRYPETPKRDLLHTVQQKLRRYIDLGWIEVAPFQLHFGPSGSRERPLRVWRENYLGVVSHYDLDYGRINPKNADLDSFNHHVTAGWVAVSDGERGLLVAQSAGVLASYAFAPMRLREVGGKQYLWINPFGSYHGRQMDYSHLGGNGLGAEIAVRKGAQFRPNAPSYNGRHEFFSLLIAPYEGDAPSEELRAVANSFFQPPAVVYERTPEGVDVRLPHQMRRLIEDGERALARATAGRPGPPRALLLNPTDAAIDVVWDPPADAIVDGYEVAWRPADGGQWQSLRTGPATRHRISALENGARYEVRVRALGPREAGDWSETLRCTVGPVIPPKMAGEVRGLGVWTLLRILYFSLVHVLTT